MHPYLSSPLLLSLTSPSPIPFLTTPPLAHLSLLSSNATPDSGPSQGQALLHSYCRTLSLSLSLPACLPACLPPPPSFSLSHSLASPFSFAVSHEAFEGLVLYLICAPTSKHQKQRQRERERERVHSGRPGDRDRERPGSIRRRLVVLAPFYSLFLMQFSPALPVALVSLISFLFTPLEPWSS